MTRLSVLYVLYDTIIILLFKLSLYRVTPSVYNHCCSTELHEVCNWFKCNKLSLNASKTNLMLLGTAYKTKNANTNSSDGCQLTRLTNTKFLGKTIDVNLTWKPHIENVCKLCSRNLGVLNKVKHFLPKNSLYQLYCSFILPYLSYGILSWGNASIQYMTKIFKLQ